jgi:hypothetical protein
MIEGVETGLADSVPKPLVRIRLLTTGALCMSRDTYLVPGRSPPPHIEVTQE